jgi:DNA-binding FrmR family transcriptional regulator
MMFCTTTLSPPPETYGDENDQELKDILTEFKVVLKAIDEVVDKVLNKVAKKVLNDD